MLKVKSNNRATSKDHIYPYLLKTIWNPITMAHRLGLSPSGFSRRDLISGMNFMSKRCVAIISAARPGPERGSPGVEIPI